MPDFRIDQPLPGERLPGGEFLQRSAPGVSVGQRPPLIVCTFDGLGSALVAGKVGYLRCNWAGNITAWSLIADQVGSVQIDIWKLAFSVGIPSVANTITNGSPPALSTQQSYRALHPAFTPPSFADGDVLAFHLDSAATIQWCTLALETELA